MQNWKEHNNFYAPNEAVPLERLKSIAVIRIGCPAKSAADEEVILCSKINKKYRIKFLHAGLHFRENRLRNCSNRVHDLLKLHFCNLVRDVNNVWKRIYNQKYHFSIVYASCINIIRKHALSFIHCIFKIDFHEKKARYKKILSNVFNLFLDVEALSFRLYHLLRNILYFK